MWIQVWSLPTRASVSSPVKWGWLLSCPLSHAGGRGLTPLGSWDSPSYPRKQAFWPRAGQRSAAMPEGSLKQLLSHLSLEGLNLFQVSGGHGGKRPRPPFCAVGPPRLTASLTAWRCTRGARSPASLTSTSRRGPAHFLCLRGRRDPWSLLHRGHSSSPCASLCVWLGASLLGRSLCGCWGSMWPKTLGRDLPVCPHIPIWTSLAGRGRMRIRTRSVPRDQMGISPKEPPKAAC